MQRELPYSCLQLQVMYSICIHLCIRQLIYHSPVDGFLVVPYFAIVSVNAMNNLAIEYFACVQACMWVTCEKFCWAKGMCICGVNTCQISLQGGSTYLYSHQQCTCMSVLLKPHLQNVLRNFSIFVNLVGEKCYLMLTLSKNSFIVSGVECFLVFKSHLYFLLLELSIMLLIFVHFLLLVELTSFKSLLLHLFIH